MLTPQGVTNALMKSPTALDTVSRDIYVQISVPLMEGGEIMQRAFIAALAKANRDLYTSNPKLHTAILVSYATGTVLLLTRFARKISASDEQQYRT